MKTTVNEFDNIIANLTRGEKKVYDFWVKYQQKNLFLPTMIEIGEGTGIKSTSGVSLYLDRLEAHGLDIEENSTTPSIFSPQNVI